MSHESYALVMQSPHRVDLGPLQLYEASKVREWLNANADDEWFFLYGRDNIRISFMEESDLIKFMLMKAEIVDSFPR